MLDWNIRWKNYATRTEHKWDIRIKTNLKMLCYGDANCFKWPIIVFTGDYLCKTEILA